MEMGDLEDQTNPSADQQEITAILKKLNRPVTLKFYNVVYKTKSKNGRLYRGKDSTLEEKVILKGITGAVVPGEMLAILGPSGSGKTTLLTALGGRLGGHLSGSITYNGKPFSNSMNRNIGFVTQDDKFHPHLTVTETLIFSALLRLPKTLTKEEKIMQAKAVISQLGLTKCKDTIIGGPFVRGISGGERKRVSIGQEILINPSLLFLDEPTSGLDSRSAQQVVSILFELTQGGRTVLMSIHQPSSRIFYMFHKILLLCNPLYFGKGEETMDYFFSIGYASSVAINPADFLVDLADGVHLDDSNLEKMMAVKQDLVSAYKSKLANRLIGELQEFDNPFSDVIEDKGFGRWSTSWGQQFLVLLRRDLKERKHESFSHLNIIQVLVFSFVCGILWWQSSTAHLQDQMGFLFFYSLFWSVRPFYNSIPTFPQEQMMLIKERSSSMYRLSSYFIARTIGDLPMELALPTIFVTITYWMVGLKPGHFFKTLFVILYSVLVAQGIGLALGAILMNIRAAVTLGAVIIETFFLAGGYYVQDVPRFISWFKYVSHTHYTYKLLLGSQYKTDDLYGCGPNETCRVGSYPAIEKMGLGNEAISFVALGIMLVGYRVIAYVALMKNIGVTH